MRPVGNTSVAAWIAIALSIMGMLATFANWTRSNDLDGLNARMATLSVTVDKGDRELKEDIRELRGVLLKGDNQCPSL